MHPTQAASLAKECLCESTPVILMALSTRQIFLEEAFARPHLAL